MKRWTSYTAISALLVVISAVLVGVWFESGARSGIWAGLAVAWLVQALAFALLIAATRWRPKMVVAGWTAGTLLRLAAVVVLAWLTLADIWLLPAEPTLIALAAGIFGLLILEPVIFSRGLKTR